MVRKKGWIATDSLKIGIKSKNIWEYPITVENEDDPYFFDAPANAYSPKDYVEFTAVEDKRRAGKVKKLPWGKVRRRIIRQDNLR